MKMILILLSWSTKFGNGKALKKDLREELMPVAWHQCFNNPIFYITFVCIINIY